ncbi:MAG TPA: AAA family ATPase [Conexibacter sp.]|jgi:ATP-dependent 26S proteasome regulatory subunit
MTERAPFAERITQLCRARFPFIYVRTWEEERLIRELMAVADGLTPRRLVYTWSIVDGLARVGERPQAGTEESLRALDAVERAQEPGIYVFKDLHVLLRDRTRDERTIRKMRDLVASLMRNPARNVVIVAPNLHLPAELEKDVTILDFELPTVAEIKAVLDRLIARNREHGRIEITLDAEGERRLVDAARGLTLGEVEHAFAAAMVEDDRLDASDVVRIHDLKRQAIARTEILEFVSTGEDFDDVGGLENLKRWLAKRDGAWLEPARRYGLPFPKGLLITGVPGCGKSLTARCMSSAWGLPLLRLDVGRVFSSLLGDSEGRMRSALHTAEAIAPSVLWIDEIEKAFGSAGSPSLDGGTSNRVFGSFLTWMQEKDAPVFVVATANNIDRLPAEFLRKGRFDEIFFVDLPTAHERERIFDIHLRSRLTGKPDVQGDFESSSEVLAHLTAQTEGFSGAEIEQIVITSLFDAFAEQRSLTRDDLLRAIANTVPLSTTQAEQVRAIREWANQRAVSATGAIDREPVASGVAAGGDLSDDGDAYGRGGRTIDF